MAAERRGIQNAERLEEATERETTGDEGESPEIRQLRKQA